MTADGPWQYDPEADAPKGVWVVWVSASRMDGICGVWAEEVEALRFVNDSGYGKAEFHEFGQIA